MNIYEQFVCAIYSISRYNELVKLRMKKVVLYLALLVFICFSLVLVIFAYPEYKAMGGINGFIDKLPEFTLSNGKLSAETATYVINGKNGVDGVYVYVDTTKPADRELLKGNNAVIIADSEKIISYNGLKSAEFKYSEFIVYEKLNKEIIIDQVPEIKIWFFISLILTYLLILLYFFGIALYIVLISNLFNLVFVRAPIKFWGVFRIVIYAMTMPLLLSIVLSAIGIKMPGIVVIGIVYAYVFLGLKNVKNTQNIYVDTGGVS